MVTSLRERVVDAVATRLAAVSPPNIPGTIAVFRARPDAVPADQRPALVVHTTAGAPPAELVGAGTVRNRLLLRIEAFVDAVSDDGRDAQINDLAAAVQGAVEADPTLGGHAVDTIAVSLDPELVDHRRIGGDGALVAEYQVEFWTAPGDPYAPAP